MSGFVSWISLNLPYRDPVELGDLTKMNKSKFVWIFENCLFLNPILVCSSLLLPCPTRHVCFQISIMYVNVLCAVNIHQTKVLKLMCFFSPSGNRMGTGWRYQAFLSEQGEIRGSVLFFSKCIDSLDGQLKWLFIFYQWKNINSDETVKLTCICLQETIKNDKDCTLLIAGAEVHFLHSARSVSLPQRKTLI